jgi:nucleoside 2-deoxyribosyltransferase
MSTARARQLIRSMHELKVQVGDETRGANSAEHDALQAIFTRLAHITARLDTAPDETAVLQIEVEQARWAAMEHRDLLQRRHLNIAGPPWRAPSTRDANLVFYSGPLATRSALAYLVRPFGVALNGPSPAADSAAARWRDLRAAGSAIFDLTATDPQAHYDLGVALALGTHMVVLADARTCVPFDVGQDIVPYRPHDVAAVLPAALDTALYGAATVTDPRSSVDAAVHYARLLAGMHGSPHAMSLFADLPPDHVDPIEAHSLLLLLDSLVPERNLVVLRSRWAASFPTGQRRCFVIMPFREELAPTWATIQGASTGTEVQMERGDQAQGQEIIGSIWAEIGRASEVVVDLTGFNPNVCIELGIADTLGKPVLLIGKSGTEAELATRIPSLAKRRCHPYTRSDDLAPLLARFLGGGLAWV